MRPSSPVPSPVVAGTAERTPSGLPPRVLFAGYVILCLLPLLLAAIQGRPLRADLFRELSGGLIMVAYVMMLAQFVMSGRFEALTGPAGIDRVMRFHQLATWVILAAVVLHPLLYSVRDLSPDPMNAVGSLHRRFFVATGLRTGVIAFWLTILLVLMAVWRDRLPFRYEWWRLTHGVLAILIALYGTHHTLRVGTYSSGPVLAGFWYLATAAAVLTMAWIYLVKPLLQMRRPYRLAANRRVADGMWELELEPEGGRPPLRYAAGQFAWVNFGHSPFSLTEHPFSMSSAPAQHPRIGFTIKEAGDFTGRIGQVPLGARSYIDGPHGNFIMAGRKATGVVFIAGGVGFAPVMGILRQLKAEGYPRPLRLIYGNRVETQILYRDEIDALSPPLDFEVHYVLSEPPAGWTGLKGDLAPDILARCLDPLSGDDWLYFVCGPPVMITAVDRALRARGVPKARIIEERFKYD
jgi:predicted ferric reductase